MPKRLTKREMDDEVYKLWFGRLCTFGLKQAKKMMFEAYKILREKENERKKKNERKS